MAADDIPSFADLRRKGSRRSTSSSKDASTPSLFDLLPTVAPADPPQPPTPVPKRAAPPSPQASVVAVSPPEPEAPAVFTVSGLVRRVRAMVERSYGSVTVEGEISNWRPAASGHCYFTLKDRDAQLSIVMFRRQSSLLRFKPKDGDAVRLRGQLSIYDARGQMQLIAETMEPLGLGALLAALQALKARLRSEGLFDNARPLPEFPRCIGVVTSLQGAALRDIVKVCRRRHAAVNLLIYPAAVQGPNCAREVAAGIRWFNKHPDRADVLLVARGGGSFEDLHGFNDELVVRAIAASAIPVITGIGHATDSVLADSAADLCAPTPSAAAELLTASHFQIEARVQRLHARLHRANRFHILQLQQRLSRLSAESVLRRVNDLLNRRSQHIDELAYRAQAALDRGLRSRTDRLTRLEARLRRQHISLRMAADKHRFAALQQRLAAVRQQPFQALAARLDHLSARLEALNPLRVLDRGYALVYGPAGNILRSPDEAPVGTTITAQLAKGRLRATVTSSTETPSQDNPAS
jgi:exodeoxyribonuclease VII large subunit